MQYSGLLSARRNLTLEQALHEQRQRDALHEQQMREQRMREAEVPVSGLARMICLGLAVTLSLCICRFLIKVSTHLAASKASVRCHVIPMQSQSFFDPQ